MKVKSINIPFLFLPSVFEVSTVFYVHIGLCFLVNFNNLMSFTFYLHA